MGVYGSDIYGQTTYGAPPSTTYSVAITAAPAFASGTSVISWAALGTTVAAYRLLRSAAGYPGDYNDGLVVAAQSGLSTLPGGTFIDTGLTPGRFYYYSLYVQSAANSIQWYLAGTAFVLSTISYGSGDKLWTTMPQFHRDGDSTFLPVPGTTQGQILAAYDQASGPSFSLAAPIAAHNVGDPFTITVPSLAVSGRFGSNNGFAITIDAEDFTVLSGAGTTSWSVQAQGTTSHAANATVRLRIPALVQGPLQRFLGLFGRSLDQIRTEVTALKYHQNVDLVDASRLALLGNMYGIPYEGLISMALGRKRIRYGVYLQKIKGTSQGIVDMVRATTGWTATYSTGVNLVLEQATALTNSVSFGTWISTGASLSLNTTNTPAGNSTLTAAPGYLTLTSTGTGIFTATMPAGVPGGTVTRTQTLSMIPATPGVVYTASVYARAATTTRTATVSIGFVDAQGNSPAGFNGTPTAESNAAWTRISCTATAPAGTLYAMVQVQWNGSAVSEVHYLNALQFEAAGAASTWVEPRKVMLAVQPDRSNMVTNPSLETGTTGWVDAVLGLGSTPTITQDATLAAGTVWNTPVFGTKTAKVVSSGTGANTSGVTCGTGTAGVTCTVGVDYTASVFVTSAAAVAVTPVIKWIGPNTTVTGTAVTTAASTSSWSRVSVTGRAPAGTTAVEFYVRLPGGTTVFLDGSLIERGGLVQDYFDGGFGTTYLTSDYTWYGTANASASSYYNRRGVKSNRLAVTLPDYCPALTPYSLAFAGDVGGPSAPN